MRNCSRAIPRISRRTTGSESSMLPKIALTSRSCSSKTRCPEPIRSATSSCSICAKAISAQYQAEMVRTANNYPNDSDIQEELGEIFETLHRPSEAIVYFRRALDSDARSIAALNGLGMAYLDLHDHATATQYLNDCLNIDPINYACLDNLGVAKIQAALDDDALQRPQARAPARTGAPRGDRQLRLPCRSPRRLEACRRVLRASDRGQSVRARVVRQL